jgi:hypothetical protein
MLAVTCKFSLDRPSVTVSVRLSSVVKCSMFILILPHLNRVFIGDV